MNAQTENYDEEEYEEYDEFDDDDGERGLSGLVVLLMGVVMLGAFASVVWIAYQQGIKANDGNGASAPVVTADPEPLKIENDTGDAAAAVNDRTVYDRLEGAEGDPVEVLAEGPEEPVARDTDDPIGALAAENAGSAEVVDDAVADRIASLAAADANLESAEPASAPAADDTQTASVTPPTPANTEPEPTTTAPPPAADTTPPPVATSVSAASGTHVVQVGAFRSDAEANGFWTRMEGKLGDYLDGKGPDVERADLGDRGIYYRLRVGPFTSSSDAKTYCEGLKSRGQDCLVKAK